MARCSPERPLTFHVALIFLLILGVHLIEHVADDGKLAVAAYAFHTVVHGDKINAILRKQHFHVHPHLQIVPAKPGHIFDDDTLDFTRFNIGKQSPEAGAVEVGV